MENIKKALNNKNEKYEKNNNKLNNILINFDSQIKQIQKEIKEKNNIINEKLKLIEYQINNIKQNLPDHLTRINSNMIDNTKINNMD